MLISSNYPLRNILLMICISLGWYLLWYSSCFSSITFIHFSLNLLSLSRFFSLSHPPLSREQLWHFPIIRFITMIILISLSRRTSHICAIRQNHHDKLPSSFSQSINEFYNEHSHRVNRYVLLTLVGINGTLSRFLQLI